MKTVSAFQYYDGCGQPVLLQGRGRAENRNSPGIRQKYCA